MSLKDRLVPDLDCFFSVDDFGDVAVYTPTTGATIDIIVLPDFQQDLATIMSGTGAGQFKEAFFTLRKDQVTPKIHEKITHNGIDWTIRSIQGYDGNIFRVKATTAERAKL